MLPMPPARTLLPLGAALALGACAASPPAGPSVMALPGQGKDFAAFQQDDFGCRQFAAAQTGFADQSKAATQSAVGSAAVGTVVGAAAGAALGAAAGNPGLGAAAGAGTGLLFGSAAGANNANASAGSIQDRYDIGYTQCMVAHGNTVQPSPTGFAGSSGFGYGSPGFVYGYPAYYGYGYPGFYGPTVAIGVGGWGGWGWGRGWGGWRGYGWRGYGWRGGYGGWHGGYGGWHSGGWHGGWGRH